MKLTTLATENIFDLMMQDQLLQPSARFLVNKHMLSGPYVLRHVSSESSLFLSRSHLICLLKQ